MIRHNHWLWLAWKPDCPKCLLNQLLDQCDTEMLLFHIENTPLLSAWEKAYVRGKYIKWQR